MRTATARASCEPRPEPFTRGLLKSGSFSPAFFVAREVRQRLRRGKSWRSAASCASFCPPGSGQFFRPGAEARSPRTSRLPGYKGCSTTEGGRGSFSRQVSLRTLRVKTAVHHFSRRGVVQLPQAYRRAACASGSSSSVQDRTGKAGLSEKLPILEG